MRPTKTAAMGKGPVIWTKPLSNNGIEFCTISKRENLDYYF